MPSQALSCALPPRGRAATGGELGALTNDDCISARSWSSSTMIAPPPRGAAAGELGIFSGHGAFCSTPTHLSSQSHHCRQRELGFQ
uniref:Uncharacterized protein n=1 Tax=Oryza punctata TaxID=4537 RepID=A0A0E0LMR3_ORYPU